MAQCHRQLTEHPEHPTDTLIEPIIKLSQIIIRVNEHFSLDDIDNTEIKGERMLEQSTISFCNEIESLKRSVPAQHKQNGRSTVE